MYSTTKMKIYLSLENIFRCLYSSIFSKDVANLKRIQQGVIQQGIKHIKDVYKTLLSY